MVIDYSNTLVIDYYTTLRVCLYGAPHRTCEKVLFHYMYKQIVNLFKEIKNLFKLQTNYYLFKQIGNLFEHIVNLFKQIVICSNK